MKYTEFLKKQHLELFQQMRTKHQKAVAALYLEYIAGKNLAEENKWLLYSNFYLYRVQNHPVEIYENEHIIGTAWCWKWQRELPHVQTPYNRGHFSPDIQGLLKKGIHGKIQQIQSCNLPCHEKQGMLTALNAFSLYIEKHANAAKEASVSANAKDKDRLLRIAQDCAFLVKNPPVTFRQALQFLWFMQCFLLMEAGFAGISLGKPDDYLYPYYKSSIENGTITPEEALDLLMCFYIKISEGDDSCMLTVGGNTENELTALFIDAQTAVQMPKPSISLRISQTTSDELLAKAVRLTLCGSGMPAYFNDDILKDGLRRLGVNDQTACENYEIVGCYEAVPDGYFSNTVGGSFNLYDSFLSFLETEYSTASFDEFLQDYKNYFEQFYQSGILPNLQKSAAADLARVSPFARAIRKTQFDPFFFGITILGIGILADSLYVIKKLVFDEGFTTIEHLKLEAENNFEDASFFHTIASLNGHYGSNSDESNRLAKNISGFIGQVIQHYPLGDQVIASPGLFSWGEDIRRQDYRATINGRRNGELLSYGIMPCATPGKEELTSVLMSCSNISSVLFPNGCPVMITVNPSDLKKQDILGALLRTFFASGGVHLAVNVADGTMLKEAKQNPAQYSNLLIKISGYSARFVSVDAQMQDAVIQRSDLY